MDEDTQTLMKIADKDTQAQPHTTHHKHTHTCTDVHRLLALSVCVVGEQHGLKGLPGVGERESAVAAVGSQAH
jgi:hypothetical protein